MTTEAFVHEAVPVEQLNQQRLEKIERWIYRLLLVFVATMPIIVFGRMEYVTSPLISDIGLLSSGYKIELFSHYKFFWTLLITAIVFILFLWKVFLGKGTIVASPFNIWVSAFLGALCISTMFSETIHITLYGQYNRSDGAIAWVCYTLLFFIALQIKFPKNVVSHILYCLFPFTILNFLIFTMNFYGHDLLKFSWILNVLTFDLLDFFSLNEGSQILGTLDQWNYLSGMFAMMTVAYFVWAVTSFGKWNAVIGTIGATLSTLIVFLSVSTSGFLTLLVCLPIIVFVVFWHGAWKRAVYVSVIYLIVCSAVFVIWNDRHPKIYAESFGAVISLVFGGDNVAVKEEPADAGYLPVLPEPSISGGSGRVYIWEKTWGLIKERPLVGYGMDTLIYQFPHNNIDARKGILSEKTIVDKPHNVYLGVFYGSGIIGFLCFIVLGAYTAYVLAISIWRKSWGAVPLAIFTFAYFIQAMFNDSLVAITALAFLMIGICASGRVKAEQRGLSG